MGVVDVETRSSETCAIARSPEAEKQGFISKFAIPVASVNQANFYNYMEMKGERGQTFLAMHLHPQFLVRGPGLLLRVNGPDEALVRTFHIEHTTTPFLATEARELHITISCFIDPFVQHVNLGALVSGEGGR